MFLRISFPVEFQVRLGHKSCFTSDLEDGSEGVAIFLLPEGTCRAAGVAAAGEHCR